MKNSDMPANPSAIAPHKEGLHPIICDDDGNYYSMGLTKREAFAMAAMQGLITLKGTDCMYMDITARQCVKMADTLLLELEKEESK